ncbi:hypothetical protein RclHR1_30920001 [Rhizophagus clarus]|uniref:Uncharacterized protein n=1 Tax=Rhizophagus clarus TaxID=94130 RepID=A0A2Z6R9Z5_9GLOM|nr:hypothetical protein RclHR1_30920001 [Rhizophagus clarus]
MQKYKPQVLISQLVIGSVIATLGHFGSTYFLKSFIFPVLDKVAHDAENKLEKINNKYQLELKMVYIVEKRKAPETHDNLPKMDMDMDFKHQSITTTVAISTTSSPVSEEHDLSWKQALTKSQRKKLKKQAKAEEKNTFFRNKTRLLLRLHHLAPLLMVNTRHSKSPRHRCLGLLQND